MSPQLSRRIAVDRVYHAYLPATGSAGWDAVSGKVRHLHMAYSPLHACASETVFTTPFSVSFWPMFDNRSAANSALRHRAKHLDKLHSSLSNLQNRLDTSSSMVTVISALCITLGISKTVWPIICSFRHCAACFAYLPTRMNIWHNTFQCAFCFYLIVLYD